MNAVALVSHTNENDINFYFKSKLTLPLEDVNKEVTINYRDLWHGIIYSVLIDNENRK